MLQKVVITQSHSYAHVHEEILTRTCSHKSINSYTHTHTHTQVTTLHFQILPGVPDSIASRIFSHRVLWLTRLTPENIKSIPAPDLMNRYSYSETDIVEVILLCPMGLAYKQPVYMHLLMPSPGPRCCCPATLINRFITCSRSGSSAVCMSAQRVAPAELPKPCQAQVCRWSSASDGRVESARVKWHIDR